MTCCDRHALGASSFADLPTAVLEEPLNEGSDSIGLRFQHCLARQPLLSIWLRDAECDDGGLIRIFDSVWAQRNIRRLQSRKIASHPRRECSVDQVLNGRDGTEAGAQVDLDSAAVANQQVP